MIDGLLTSGLPILLSIVSVMVAATGASPILIQVLTYKFKQPSIQFDIMYVGANMNFGDEAMEVIDWWRLDKEESQERYENGQIDTDRLTMPQLRVSEFGSTRGIYIDRIEITQEGNESWDTKGEGQFLEEIHPGRHLVNPQVFTMWPETTPGPRITDSAFLGAGRSTNMPFPFAAKPSSVEFKITIHTSLDADEIFIPFLGPLPRFLGNIRLKPVKKIYLVSS